MSRPLKPRRPLAPKQPAAKVERFLKSGRKTQWKPGVSGNPNGSRARKGVSYKEFVEDCRALTPLALKRLQEALSLPWDKSTARTILTAAALTIERAFGRAIAVNVDLQQPPADAPAIELTETYWSDLVGALKDSGALEIPTERKPEVIDAEVVEVKLIDPPKT